MEHEVEIERAVFMLVKFMLMVEYIYMLMDMRTYVLNKNYYDGNNFFGLLLVLQFFCSCLKNYSKSLNFTTIAIHDIARFDGYTKTEIHLRSYYKLMLKEFTSRRSSEGFGFTRIVILKYLPGWKFRR